MRKATVSSGFQEQALLTGRRAIVTGAAGGIGAAIAESFEQAGASVVRWDIGSSDRVCACDVTDEKAVAAAFVRAGEAGSVSDVIHAAGVAATGPVAETSVDAFRRVIEINLTGTFIVSREAARRLPRGGNLVLIASQAGLKGGAMWGAYSASKGGVLRLADCLAEELAERGIRVNSISPGNVDTAMMSTAMSEAAKRSGEHIDDVRARYERAIPMRRFARPEEIGRAAVALCSGLLSYVNGANLVVDGGELSR
jgi:NAD(P)-dependent dehydrogenase (short-subunit alcohol dehydrogenase family)